jgi:sec-independent protein translocase protein TatA
MNTQLIAWMPGPIEWGIIAVVALLIFGRRLPDVARSMGRSIVEFKKGLKGVKDDLDTADDDTTEPKKLPPDNSTKSES